MYNKNALVNSRRDAPFSGDALGTWLSANVMHLGAVSEKFVNRILCISDE